MVLAMLVFCLPMQVFAEEIGESRLFSVDFSPRVDMNREFNPDVYTYTTSVNTSEKVSRLHLMPWTQILQFVLMEL